MILVCRATSSDVAQSYRWPVLASTVEERMKMSTGTSVTDASTSDRPSTVTMVGRRSRSERSS